MTLGVKGLTGTDVHAENVDFVNHKQLKEGLSRPQGGYFGLEMTGMIEGFFWV